jgi:hypothetical protein
MVDHPFGTITRGMDQGYGRTRGLANVRAELRLTVRAYTLKRVITILGGKPRSAAVRWRASGLAARAPARLTIHRLELVSQRRARGLCAIESSRDSRSSDVQDFSHRLAVEPTPNSLRSYVAPAIGRGSPRALGAGTL